jgi:energy-coupling factor transporter ATP-binding protein EcfA2
VKKSVLKRRINDEYGVDPLNLCDKEESINMLRLVKIYHDLKEETNTQMVDDITWEDIEMDEVFFRVNHTRSFAGEQILYHMLHMIPNETTKKQINKPKIDEEILLILSIVLAIFKPVFIALAIFIAVINLVVYMFVKMLYDNTITSLSSIRELVEFCEYIQKSDKLSALYMNEELKKSVTILKRTTKILVYLKYNKAMVDSGNIQAIILDYIYGITMIDAICCSLAIKKLKNHKNEILLLYELVGRVDSAISVASFRRSLDSCKPEITENGHISCRGLYHPLVNSPVKNDFNMKKNSFFTGANASGKSTFMKAIAINVILGETIYTCTADGMSFPQMYVMSSMALRDDVLNGESYYVREIKYLKRMIEKVESGEKTLIVIDEILKGTNTKERVAASKAVLEYLSDTFAIVITATHDIELVTQMADLYDAYYFECIVRDGTVKFMYEIREGINKITNAIELMKGMGFPDKIITSAESGRG